MAVINWQDAITNTVATIGGGGVCVLSAAWLIRSVISDRLKAHSDAEIERVKNALAKEAEAFKIQVKADADAANERLKNSLQIVALEHQVRFSALHEKRILVVGMLYEQFVKAYSATRAYYQWTVFPEGPSEQEQAGLAWLALQKAYEYLERNKIYVSDSLSTELNSFFNRAKYISLTLKLQYVEAVQAEQTDVSPEEARKTGLDAFEKDFLVIKQRLNMEFKNLLEPSKLPRYNITSRILSAVFRQTGALRAEASMPEHCR